MKHLLILLTLLCSTGLLAQSTKDISAFKTISTSGSVEVELIHSDEYKAVYEMKKGSADKLVIDNNGDELVVKIKSNLWGASNAKAHVVIHYTGPIEGMSASAGSTLTSHDIVYTQNLTAEASSGSSLHATVDAGSFDGDVSSGARLVVKGKAKNGSFEASSGSSLKADKLEVERANADVSSGANIKVWATSEITADASSGGSITYKGNPSTKNIDRSSGGSVKGM